MFDSRQISLLWQDIGQSLLRWRFWVFLGWNDIVQRYRRSFVGPVWITLNTAVFILAFGLIGAQLFQQQLSEYLAYFAVGHVIFSFLAQIINDGCQTFTGADAFLKQTPYPKMAFVLRVVWRNLLLLAHNFVIVLAVLAWTGHLWRVQWGWLVLALVISLLMAVMVVAVLGALATRFRDVPMAISSLMQISFFVTPVMWQPGQLTERAKAVVHFNPLAAYLDLIRQPLMGKVPDGWLWTSVGWSLLVGLVVYVVLFLAVRRRIVYWL